MKDPWDDYDQMVNKDPWDDYDKQQLTHPDNDDR